jgi:type IV pilus assembly protein PilP
MQRSWKRASAWCLSFVSVLLVLTAVWMVSVSVADEPGEPQSGQTAIKRPLPVAPVARQVTAAVQPQPTPNEVAPKLPTPKPLPAGPVQAATPAGGAAAKAPPVISEQKTNPSDNAPSSEAQHTPEQLSAIVKKTAAMLDSPKFTFLPDRALDPFVPFVALQTTNDHNEPGAGACLTPLQKMSLAEMETGLRAIAGGGLGKMAVIEDSTGKGYIVGVGTPAGPNGGVITQIQDNCLTIQQEVWNSQTRKRFPEVFTVKMVKKNDQ